MHKLITDGESVPGTGVACARTVPDRRSAGNINLANIPATLTEGAFALNIPISASFAAERTAKLSQIKHRLRWGSQQIATPDLAVVGGYHHGNLGDMAMGHSVARRIAAKNYSCGLHTIYNLNHWPRTKGVIVGGGAVGYSSCLRQLAAKYGDDPEHVALLGVDFNDPEALRAHASFLNRVALVTCRSTTQAANLSEVLGRKDITWHPDLCFSLHGQPDEAIKSVSDSRRILGINCVPLFLKKSGRRFVPGTSYLDEMKRENPGLVRYIDKLGLLYCDLVRSICHHAKRAGLRVKHIPFTPVDDMFARAALGDLGVEFVSYTSNVPTVLAQVGQCRQFFTTRFHSLVLSLLKHCTITPFCYASKCDRLLEDFGISDAAVIRLTDLLEHKKGIAERIVEGQGIHFSANSIMPACDRVTSAIDNAIAAITTHLDVKIRNFSYSN